MPTVLEQAHEFVTKASVARRNSLAVQPAPQQWSGIEMAGLFLGVAAKKSDSDCVDIGLSVHDGTYSVDFNVQRVCPTKDETIDVAIKESVRSSIVYFSQEHHGKFIAAGLTEEVVRHCPGFASFLWRELDILGLIPALGKSLLPSANRYDSATIDGMEFGVDEEADSAVRKAILYFGPNHLPLLAIGFRNAVQVDTDGVVQIVNSLDEYKATVTDNTWNTILHYASVMKKNKIKVAFFSATPQGGGVALMRHALIRFFNLLGIHVEWFVPKPSPAVFRITKNNHNILQGVSAPGERFTEEYQAEYTQWIEGNARRYWLSDKGPLAEGGADVVVIDDPQMPGLIPLIKSTRPNVKIIYRSHIEIRSELINVEGSPQQEVWSFLWDRIRHADVFISHPVANFVPHDVPKEKLGLMPATTDWLDGLNKEMRDWDLRYYHHILKVTCIERQQPTLLYPARQYIVQIARFDPSKGIDTVIDGYYELRELYKTKPPEESPPQLLICGHGSRDDPDGSIIFDKTMAYIKQSHFDDIRQDIVVVQLGPSDQLLDAIISTAKIVFQLSSREGFEVKVSEALHKGKPVIATRAGGIPLQVQDGKNGFLVDVGDAYAVAKKAFELFTNEELYSNMSNFAKRSVSDEVGTIGNAVCWMYLASKLGTGEKVEGGAGLWVADMARNEAGIKWGSGENRLPRGIKVTASVPYN